MMLYLAKFCEWTVILTGTSNCIQDDSTCLWHLLNRYIFFTKSCKHPHKWLNSLAFNVLTQVLFSLFFLQLNIIFPYCTKKSNCTTERVKLISIYLIIQQNVTVQQPYFDFFRYWLSEKVQSVKTSKLKITQGTL